MTNRKRGKTAKAGGGNISINKVPEYGGCASLASGPTPFLTLAGVHWHSILLSFSGVVALLLAGYHGGVRKSHLGCQSGGPFPCI